MQDMFVYANASLTVFNYVPVLTEHIGTAAVEWASVNIVHSVIWIVCIVLFVKFGLNGYKHNILFSFNNLPDLMYVPPEPQNLSQNGLG